MEDPGRIVPETVMQKLSRKLDPKHSIVVTEVGQHQMWAAQFIDREKPRTFISSGGLGTMGFGFPAAIGAAFGRPDDQVVWRRRRRIVPDELPGDGHGRHQRRAGEGAHPG